VSSLQVHAISSTTTASRIRGFTVELLGLLKNDVVSVFELSEITDRPLKLLRIYLSRLKKYGLIEGEGEFWTASDEGLYILSLLSSRKNQNKILSKRLDAPENIKSYSSKSYTGNSNAGTDRQHFDNSSTTLRQHFPKQLTLEKAFQRLNLNDCEKEVVEALLAHYNRTRSAFIYINFIEDLQVDYSFNILQEAIRKLRQDNIIYIWQDRAMNALKLGLKKAFLEKLGTLSCKS